MHAYYKSLYLCLIFMKRINPIRSFTGIVVIFFLLAPIVCSTINSFSPYRKTQGFVVTKKANTPSRSDTQLPEKVESENDRKPHNNFFFIHPVGEFTRFNITKSQRTFSYNAFRFWGIRTDIPLYLSKRSIVI